MKKRRGGDLDCHCVHTCLASLKKKEDDTELDFAREAVMNRASEHNLVFFFGRYGPRRLRLQLSVPTKLIETNKHKKTGKQRSELLNDLLQHADFVSSGCSATRRSFSQRLSRSDSGSAPKATQDNGWSPRPRLRRPFWSRRTTDSPRISCESCHQSPSAKSKASQRRPTGMNPRRRGATLR